MTGGALGQLLGRLLDSMARFSAFTGLPALAKAQGETRLPHANACFMRLFVSHSASISLARLWHGPM